MTYFYLIMQIQENKLFFSVFRIFCKNWVLNAFLDQIRNSRNGLMVFIFVGHLDPRWIYLYKAWELILSVHPLVYSNRALIGSVKCGQIGPIFMEDP